MRGKTLFSGHTLFFTISFLCGCSDVITHKENTAVQQDPKQHQDKTLKAAKKVIHRLAVHGLSDDGSYVNTKLGFSLEIPVNWMNSIAYEERYNTGNMSNGASDHAVVFYYSPSEGIYQFLFSVSVFNKEIPQEEWSDLMVKHVEGANGKTYTFEEPLEPSEILLQQENADKLAHVQDMVKQLPDIIRTFKAFPE